MQKDRTGKYVKQLTGYSAFIPKHLPPDPPIEFSPELIYALSLADRKLGRLDGITQTLPNPDLFVAMYVKKEAVLSSQIEGTQASFVDVLENDEAIETGKEKSVEEVVNYISAMNYGLEQLKNLPICLRLIKEIHSILLKDVRGSEKSPGEFRSTQNWIGAAGCNLMTASFVPPNPDAMLECMYRLEEFIHSEDSIPPLIKIGLIHAHFETVHPFLDGNGRMGRLLITFWLCQQKILSRPLLYLSYYFKRNRSEYYDRLMDIRFKGNWENWILFFLNGISSVSDEAINTAKSILGMKEEHTDLINIKIKNASNGLRLLDRLFEQPVISIGKVAEILDISYPTANNLVNQFCDLGILENPKQQRNKKFSYKEYINILQEGTEI